MTAEPESVTTRRNDAESRYEGWRGEEQLGLLDFVRTDGQIVFTHAETFPQYEGQGVGSAIVRHALDEVRANGTLAVVPQCPFVRAWIGRHPDYQSLLTTPVKE